MQKSIYGDQTRTESAVFDRTVKVFDSRHNLGLERSFFIGDYTPNPAWKKRHDSVMDDIVTGFEEAVDKIEDLFEEHPDYKDFNSLNLKFSD